MSEKWLIDLGMSLSLSKSLRVVLDLLRLAKVGFFYRLKVCGNLVFGNLLVPFFHEYYFLVTVCILGFWWGLLLVLVFLHT